MILHFSQNAKKRKLLPIFREEFFYSILEFFVDFSLDECIISLDRNLSKGCDFMKLKKVLSFLAAFALIFTFYGCSPEAGTTEENLPEEVLKPENLEPEDPKETKPAEEPVFDEKTDDFQYMSFEEITNLGYYPLWMQPHTYIIYDEKGLPEITEGGVLLEEDTAGREDIRSIGYIDTGDDEIFRIQPNTKLEYDLHGFIQNIYYLWPDGNYNLSPPFYDIEAVEITYYEDIKDFGQEKGKKLILSEVQYFDIYMLAEKMKVRAENTGIPMDFPRYEITFINGETEHHISIDINNIFASTLIGNGNYISALDIDYFSKVEEIFNNEQ